MNLLTPVPLAVIENFDMEVPQECCPYEIPRFEEKVIMKEITLSWHMVYI